MTLSDPRLWLDLAQSAALVILWLRKPGQDAMSAVAALGLRMAVVEERLSHMPTDDELSKLGGTVLAIERETEAQSARLNSIGAQLNRIETYLLNRQP